MPGEHILIVDDERAIQSTLRGVLEDEGYRVTAVGSGEQALARLQDDTPDIIFLDIWMPGIDGLDTLAERERVPEHHDPRVDGRGALPRMLRVPHSLRVRLVRQVPVRLHVAQRRVRR